MTDIEKLAKEMEELDRRISEHEKLSAPVSNTKFYGQRNLIARLTDLIYEGKFPRFTILTGPEGQGKKSVVRQIFKGKTLVEVADTKVDTVREIINQAYKNAEETIYLIPDADNMSVAAKNALLKVTEEPPRKAYFIMTLTDINNTLATIKSRATVFSMNEYSYDELKQYAKEVLRFTQDDTKLMLMLSLCTNINEVSKIARYDVTTFYDYVNLVVDNVANVSCANALKIGSKIAFKADADESLYDLRLFWRAFMEVCKDRMMTESPIRYANAVKITSTYLRDLSNPSINKSNTFDMWMFAIREAWS